MREEHSIIKSGRLSTQEDLSKERKQDMELNTMIVKLIMVTSLLI